jgi:hypothetical protein
MLTAVLALTLLAALPACAYRITGITVLMDIQPDSSVMVTETIAADFTGAPLHGIYRQIPLSVQDKYGLSKGIHIDLLSVTDQDGQPIQYKSRIGGGQFNIKIGNPSQLVFDARVYVVKYKVFRAVQFYDEHDELYWNALGPSWDVPIEQASCYVRLPGAVKKENIMMRSFTGSTGSTGSDAGQCIQDERTVAFWTTSPAYPGQNFTIVLGWPKGMVSPPSRIASIFWFMSDNAFVFPPIVMLLGMFGLWYWKGRDPDTGKSEVVTYDPPDNLSPIEIGTLIDERVDMRDISATIIDLAVRGYIGINATSAPGFITTSTDYTFGLKKPYGEVISDPNISLFERSLISFMFSGSQSVSMSSLKGTFYKNLKSLKATVYSMLVSKGYFDRSPDSVRQMYQVPAVALGIIGFIMLRFGMGRHGLPVPMTWTISLIACAIILGVGSFFMPRKTAKGKNALLGIKGFEEYLARAEKPIIQHQERQGYFEKFLPYAMAFGIASKWSRAFDGLQDTPPQWFNGGYYHNYRPSMFGSDMDAASRSWGSTLAYTPRSSGGSGGSGFGSGGFSGGGFGGGGGGGW